MPISVDLLNMAKQPWRAAAPNIELLIDDLCYCKSDNEEVPDEISDNEADVVEVEEDDEVQQQQRPEMVDGSPFVLGRIGFQWSKTMRHCLMFIIPGGIDYTPAGQNRCINLIH